jgi:Leucine-rich repeat (LRR) protein
MVGSMSIKQFGLVCLFSLFSSVIVGCGSSQPAEVPADLQAYVSEGPGGPFLRNPTPGTYLANLASDRSLTPEKQKALLEKLASYGYISQLILRSSGESIDGITALKRLEGVHLSFGAGAAGKSVDLSVFQQMPQLKELTVGYEAGVQLNDARIAVPANLIQLSLYQLPVTSIDGLENCKTLQYLDVSFNPKLENVTGFGSLGPLKKLRISESTLTKLAASNIAVTTELLEITEANSLVQTKGKAVDISIYGMEGLKRLDGLENWQGAKRLTLNYLRALEDITALERMTELTELTLIECQLNGKAATAEDLETIGQKLPNCKILVK